jgi:DNA-directed RNA polymerase subunit alpha
MRAYNCLRRSGLMTVGQVLEKSEEELLALRNFGRKSYDELRERLDELGLLPADSGGADEGELPEALPLDGEEAPISAMREAAAAEAESAIEAGAAAEEAPAPVAKKGRSKKAAKEAAEGGEEEEPEWKRKLRALTGEEEA